MTSLYAQPGHLFLNSNFKVLAGFDPGTLTSLVVRPGHGEEAMRRGPVGGGTPIQAV